MNVDKVIDKTISNIKVTPTKSIDGNNIINLTPENQGVVYVKEEKGDYGLVDDFMINKFHLDSDDNKLRFNLVLDKKAKLLE